MRRILRFGGLWFFFRQRLNRPACLLKSGFVRPPIREALAGSTFHGKGSTFAIVKAKLGAVIKTKIVFGEIAMQMLLAAMLIDAAHTALED